ncbi:DNA segregation ATPase FtsK/SpoIIIE, S-DNA-T family [Saccharopolyspora kobensis]|uniref:DNA segregation ATPase FtsK/SpoIIIE, S-DNA-T family n=1 Tax=Saccharopolyspora kobensis TaxID=146035 RepID=A0A1H6BZM5_9PSEU|nr:type VII secretion protein EccCb [Saccharopolyspora kobensis]SEG66112.1 DNA segregation ATPase FtsK/SpoIIIE, S-DNA-T family [Saccharopolyspora kobensis]SFC22061.1 DNA segregation ATPase FtsK/SpoIIIE, S-DNA-T family [Saccharopolyspora kobensis]
MGARHALLVATSNYTDPGLRRLRSPVQEAHELRDLLADPAIGAFDSAVMAVNESKAEIERRIEALFRDRTSEDTVLLFISGHGIKNDHGELFFAACNTELQLPYSTAIPAVVVQRLIRESQAQSATVVLDCCYSGVFTNDIIARSSTAIDVEEQLGGGVYVMTATNEIEYAYEQEKLVLNKPVSASAFTSALIDGLRTGAADSDRDGVITAEELYQFASRKVRAIGQQTPKNGGVGQGAIRIAKAARRQLSGESGAKLLLGELIAPDSAAPGVPIGKAHEVDRHHGDLVRIDPFGHQGHLAVVGRFRSGKSTLLRTLIVGHAATHPATEVRFHCLDSDGGLVGMQRWDNVVANAIDLAGAQAVLRDVAALIEQRKQLFHRYGIESIDTYRALRRKSADRMPGIDHADVFLVVDGWETFAEDVPDFTTSIRKIAERGLACGVHVVLTARQWENIPRQVALLLQGHIELTLDEPTTSRIDPELAATLPAEPGWALSGRQRFRVALPKMDAEEELVDLFEVLERPSVALEAPQDAFAVPVDPAELWNLGERAPRPVEDQYKVVFGVNESGRPVELDIKETARGGMGPHGLCVGATGSGKSEFLRTFVLGMMAAHDTTELNFVLIDFKGRATFQDFAASPHVSAVISNLESDGSLIDRMADALSGELNRRQEVLNKAGAKNVWDYRRMAAAGDERCREPLPALVVVVDEFSELLAQQPDFIELFVMIGRLGRSLQVHLLLASQRLEEGRLRGLDAHLSYRIGLKTFSAAESRAAIGEPDAADLPASGGHGYLKHPGGMVRFRAAYASGPTDSGASFSDEVLAGVRDLRPRAREIWLPPLDLPPTLDALLPEAGTAGRLQVPVGLIDVPYHQRQEPMLVDLSGPAGHAAIVGGTRSGKSTALRALIASLALTHTPSEVQFYCLDFGGGGLFALRDLPHVGGIGGRRDRELVARTVGELRALLDRREAWFQQHGVEGMTDYRNRKRNGAFPDDDYGDAFLVIDGWRTFREEFEEFEHDVLNLAATGIAYGIHVVVTATRWAEIRPAVKDLMQTRIELRLGDPSESEIDRKSAAKVPHGRPGRGLHASKLHFLTALPRVDGAQLGARPDWASYTEDLAEGVAALAERVRSSWSGAPAPPVRLLPKLLPHEQLPRPEQQPNPKLVPIGLNEDELAPVYLDFAAEPNFYAFGERESGKTSLLRTIIRGITERYTPKEALILLVDYRRTMLGFLETGHLLEYSVVESQLRGNVKDVTASLKKRLPGPDVTQEQLKSRSWWKGPELFVVVDDYDIVAPQGNNPLAPLAEFVPVAGDVGLHVVLARSSGGAGRALYEPLITKMRETSSPGLVMSAEKEEGRLVANIKPRHLPPGRGVLASRRLRGPQLIQTAHFPSE